MKRPARRSNTGNFKKSDVLSSPTPSASKFSRFKRQNTLSGKEVKKEIISNAQEKIKTYSILSQAGLDDNGKTKTNQDSYLEINKLYNINDANIFGIFDGHGPNGHLVSQCVVKYLTKFYTTNRKLTIAEDSTEVYVTLHRDSFDIIKKSLQRAEKELSSNNIDASLSGSTSCMIFQLGNKLVISNIGDSRAILVKNKEVIAISLDQKPTDEEEKKRIERFGGEVKQLMENGKPVGPFRVFKKGMDFPGIAMSRSVGDTYSTSLGVICEPDIKEVEIDDNVQFIVIASDGVWEFLENKDVMEIVLPFYNSKDAEGACKKLIEEATKRWTEKETGRDDITCIILFF